MAGDLAVMALPITVPHPCCFTDARKPPLRSKPPPAAGRHPQQAATPQQTASGSKPPPAANPPAPTRRCARISPRHAGPRARTPRLPRIPDSTLAPACLRPPSWSTVTTTSSSYIAVVLPEVVLWSRITTARNPGEVIACTARSVGIRTAGSSIAGPRTTAPRSAAGGRARSADAGLPRRRRSS
jgi:hypothetical protein